MIDLHGNILMIYKLFLHLHQNLNKILTYLIQTSQAINPINLLKNLKKVPLFSTFKFCFNLDNFLFSSNTLEH